MAIRLFVVDDHPVVRVGVRAMLAGSPVEVIADCGCGAEAVPLIIDLRPDVLLLDARVNGRDGLQCLVDLRERELAIPALIFTSHSNPTYAARASALGAVGYLRKDADRDTVLAAISQAADGRSCWSSDEVRRLTGALDVSSVEKEIEAPLTRRECEVLKQLSFGLTNRDIAEALGISYETVKEHVQHILRKLGAGDRTQAAVWAVRQGLV